MELTLDGRIYRGTASDRFTIRRDDLREAGRADRISIPNHDRIVYQLADIDPAHLVVAYALDGTAFVFIEWTFLTGLPGLATEGDEPLARAIPRLCDYWKPPQPKACTQSQPSPTAELSGSLASP